MSTVRRPLNTGPLPAERGTDDQAVAVRRVGGAVERLLVPEGDAVAGPAPVAAPQAHTPGRRPLGRGSDLR